MPELSTVNIGDITGLPEREAEHLFRTLRARQGETVRLMDGNGITAEATVSGKNSLRIDSLQTHPEPRSKIHIYTAIPKGNILPALLTSLVEAGASAIIPVNFQRSVAKPEKPNERWHMRLIEGCKQSGNPFLPALGTVMTVPEMLADAEKHGASGYFGAIGGQFNMQLSPSPVMALAIGPEGGFTEEEVAAMEAADWKGICFSPHVLRLETAAVTGCVLLNLLGRCC